MHCMHTVCMDVDAAKSDEDFSQSLIAVSFPSNILFWREHGYFDGFSGKSLCCILESVSRRAVLRAIPHIFNFSLALW